MTPEEQEPTLPIRQGRPEGEKMRALIVAAIERLTAAEGRPPTNREIGASVGMTSKGHVRYHLQILVQQGRLIHAPGVTSRCYTVPHKEVDVNTKQTLSQYLADHAEDYFRDGLGNIWLGKDLLFAEEQHASAVHVINGALYLRTQDGMPLTALHIWPIVTLRGKRQWPEAVPLQAPPQVNVEERRKP